ncbi:hypothetical protein BTM25_08890 [Actinomadura rubteroloni]|uniref:Uncharacterized protein n=1 Tax=Actinomadura rubteroloni TaxID=1926885 RepID=A0A2P4UN67_9ACTN|nr:hypothetical protein BTM25_08890 [Actinomadura rubteroloni]
MAEETVDGLARVGDGVGHTGKIGNGGEGIGHGADPMRFVSPIGLRAVRIRVAERATGRTSVAGIT